MNTSSADVLQALIAEGNLDLRPVYMALGDVLVRDVRGLHRGTPVRTYERFLRLAS
jgi:hypothetical protein